MKRMARGAATGQAQWKTSEVGKRILAALAVLLAATVSVSGCGVRHEVAESIEHGKAPVIIDGKTYAAGDVIKMESTIGTTSAHFCGDVLDGTVKWFSDVHRFAIAASQPDRDCSVAVKFFRDFIAAGAPISGSSYWQGMKVDFHCAGEYHNGTCPAHLEGGYPGGLSAQTMSGTQTPYTDAHGFAGFRAIAVGF